MAAELSPEVVTFGEAMILFLAAGETPLAHASQFDSFIAGTESNLAIGLARLGHRVGFFGRVGADVFGERIRRELRGEGVDVSALGTDAHRPTGLMVRDAVRAAPITVGYRRSGSAATALVTGDPPTSMIEQARVLHVTGITAALSDTSYEATLEAMRIATRAGVRVSFDPNLRLRLAPVSRWQEIVDTLARHCDIALTGAEEAEIFCPGVQPQTWFGERGASIVVVKRGALGASEYAFAAPAGQVTVHEPARAVAMVDPVGAGDAFDAGWLSGWLRGLAPTERLREAAAVASLVVATRGDATGLPDVATRDRVLAEGQDVER
ncbi:MAG: sugar kinase [Propionibacteriaceae bacterium]|nr:sugar kinase [Propionibacteriaceae bacterium]